MNEKIRVRFPNEGDYDISKNIISKWDIEIKKTIGDTHFCVANGGYFSIENEEYEKINL
jgi:hypothetical protein